MSNNAVQKRKDADQKPKKLFTIDAFLFDDSVIAGSAIEYRDLGRRKNQKCIVPGFDDFMSCVRSLVPSAVPAIEPLAQQLFDDMEITDTEHCEKIGKIVVDIYADSYISCDLSELVQGPRGAPKAWRMEPRDFLDMVEARVGQLRKPFEPLLTAGPYTAQVKLDTVPTDEDEEVGGYVGEVEVEDDED